MKVIGFSGYAGSGKSTAAQQLTSELKNLGITASQVSMADPLKKMAEVFLGVSNTQDKGQLIGVLNPHFRGTVFEAMTIRDFLQGFGTEGCRGWISSIWVASMQARLSFLNCDVAVIDDIRFENEATLCDKLIKIVRPGLAVGNHSSEKPNEIVCDTVIQNKESVQELYLLMQNQAQEIAKCTEKESQKSI